MVAGNRRVRAAKIAKLETIPAIIRDVDNVQARRITFIENMHRKDLCALEKAKGIAAVYEDVGITKEQAIQYLKHLHNEPEDIKKKAIGDFFTSFPYQNP